MCEYTLSSQIRVNTYSLSYLSRLYVLMYVKRDICMSKETYVCQKRHMYVRRDICMSKETYITNTIPMSQLVTKCTDFLIFKITTEQTWNVLQHTATHCNTLLQCVLQCVILYIKITTEQNWNAVSNPPSPTHFNTSTCQHFNTSLSLILRQAAGAFFLFLYYGSSRCRKISWC